MGVYKLSHCVDFVLCMRIKHPSNLTTVLHKKCYRVHTDKYDWGWVNYSWNPSLWLAYAASHKIQTSINYRLILQFSSLSPSKRQIDRNERGSLAQSSFSFYNICVQCMMKKFLLRKQRQQQVKVWYKLSDLLKFYSEATNFKFQMLNSDGFPESVNTLINNGHMSFGALCHWTTLKTWKKNNTDNNIKKKQTNPIPRWIH